VKSSDLGLLAPAALLLLLLFLVATIASAEEPKGLAALSWGASREEAIAFVRDKCNWSASRDSIRSQAIACHDSLKELLEEHRRKEREAIKKGKDDL
jgi:hypothetical protein